MFPLDEFLYRFTFYSPFLKYIVEWGSIFCCLSEVFNLLWNTLKLQMFYYLHIFYCNKCSVCDPWQRFDQLSNIPINARLTRFIPFWACVSENPKYKTTQGRYQGYLHPFCGCSLHLTKVDVFLAVRLEAESWWNTISFPRPGNMRGTSFVSNGLKTLLI